MAQLQEIVLEIGEQLGRSAPEMQKHIDLLKDNWFDTPESLKSIAVTDLSAMGLPWRLGECLVAKVAAILANDDESPRANRPRPSAFPEARETGGRKEDQNGQIGREENNHEPMHSERVALALDGVDRDYPFLNRLKGKDQQNFQHIRSKTGASVWIAGQGSGRKEPDTGKEAPEPPFVEVQCRDREPIDDAVRMIEDLVQKTFEDYDKWKEGGDRSSGKSKGKGKSSEANDRQGKGRGGRRQGQQSGDRRLASDAGELTHSRMVRLLKILQRNRMFKPDKAILDRWNEFCDKNSPLGRDGKPFRDPSRLDMELIIEFLCKHIPKPFWPILVKKLQSQGRDAGLGELWHEFCDEYAPPDERDGASTRDPKRLDPELLLAFVSSAIDVDKGHNVSGIIDDFNFDFSQEGGRQDNRNHEDNRSSRQGRGKEEYEKSHGKGRDKNKLRVNGEELAFSDSIELDPNVDSRFGFFNRLIGKDGRNVKHIREHTRAFCWLSGQGSGRLEFDTNEESPKPLHMKITADDEDSLDQAMKIARDLVETTWDAYHAWLDNGGADENRRDGGKGNRRRTDQDDDRAQKRARRD